MAYIEGLKESEQALAEIKKILKELEGINTFMSAENPTTMYKLSFTVKNTDSYESEGAEPITNLYAYENAPSAVDVIHGGSIPGAMDVAQAEKPVKKGKKITQYTAPLICDDKETLYRFVQLYKERKVRTVRQLMETHRIRLSEEELAILETPAQFE